MNQQISSNPYQALYDELKAFPDPKKVQSWNTPKVIAAAEGVCVAANRADKKSWCPGLQAIMQPLVQLAAGITPQQSNLNELYRYPSFDNWASTAEIVERALQLLKEKAKARAINDNVTLDPLKVGVTLSPDGVSLNCYGIETYHFSPGRQAASIKLLHEAWEDGQRSLSEAYIITEVMEDGGFKTNRLRDVFKNRDGTYHPAWNTIVTTVRKGTFKLFPEYHLHSDDE